MNENQGDDEKDKDKEISSNNDDCNPSWMKYKNDVTPFLSAIEKDDAAAILDFLAGNNGAPIHTIGKVDASGMTGLHHCCTFGSCKSMLVLSDFRADINAKDGMSATPLHYAARHGKAAAVKELEHLYQVRKQQRAQLRGKAQTFQNDPIDYNAKDTLGMTPIHWAAKGGFVDTALAIMKYTPLNLEPNIHGSTVLHLSANAAMTALLLKYGAEMEVKDMYDRTPLLAAGRDGRIETLKTLVNANANVQARDVQGLTLFDICASASDNVQEMLTFLEPFGGGEHYKELSEKKRLVQLKKTKSERAEELCDAVSRLDDRKISQLLQNKYDPNAYGFKGVAPLHVCCTSLEGCPDKKQRDHGIKIAKLLIENFADVTMTDVNQKITPIHCAAAAGNKKMVAFLIQMRSDVNTPDERRWTPLHYATVRNDHGTILKLLEFDGDVNATTAEMALPLHLSLDPEIRQLYMWRYVTTTVPPNLIVDAGGIEGRTPLDVAVLTGSLPQVRFLMDIVEDVNEICERDKCTAAHLAAMLGHIGILEAMIELGADLQVRSKKCNQTPLHTAAVAAQWATMFYLIEKYDMDPNDQDGDGRGVLTLSVLAHAAEPELTWLLSHGADLEQKDNQGKTASFYAGQYARLEVIHFLQLWKTKKYAEEQQRQQQHMQQQAQQQQH